MNEQRADYDSPWKEALERYFEPFMAFFFPQAHREIDWAEGYRFLDKELQRISLRGATGPRRVDKLIKVWQYGGKEAWVLVHVEVQSQPDDRFTERMYVYNYRLYDHYQREVVSLAILADEQADWRPNQFGYEKWGCKVGLTFPLVKVLDYRERWAELERSDNPFAVVVMAHLKAQETRHDAPARKEWKVSLIRRLYERGYEREDIVSLFHFIDWLIWLPPELDDEFWQEVYQYEEVKHMRYISSVERIGFRKGMEQGLQQGARLELLGGIKMGLRLKFKSEGLGLVPEVSRIEDVTVLQAITDAIEKANTVDEVRRVYQWAVAGHTP